MVARSQFGGTGCCGYGFFYNKKIKLVLFGFEVWIMWCWMVGTVWVWGGWVGSDRWCYSGQRLLGHMMLTIVGMGFVLNFFLFGSIRGVMLDGWLVELIYVWLSCVMLDLIVLILVWLFDVVNFFFFFLYFLWFFFFFQMRLCMVLENGYTSLVRFVFECFLNTWSCMSFGY